MELPISTMEARKVFSSLPTNYKVDIGNIEHKLAIEVDGGSHRGRGRKALDAKKQAVLEFLGWSVLRFWNEEILKDLPDAVARVTSFIASKSKAITTSSPTVS